MTPTSGAIPSMTVTVRGAARRIAGPSSSFLAKLQCNVHISFLGAAQCRLPGGYLRPEPVQFRLFDVQCWLLRPCAFQVVHKVSRRRVVERWRWRLLSYVVRSSTLTRLLDALREPRVSPSSRTCIFSAHVHRVHRVQLVSGRFQLRQQLVHEYVISPGMTRRASLLLTYVIVILTM